MSGQTHSIPFGLSPRKLNDRLDECDKVSIEGGANPEQLQILVLIAATSLTSTNKPIFPFVGGPDGSQSPGLFIVLSS